MFTQSAMAMSLFVYPTHTYNIAGRKVSLKPALLSTKIFLFPPTSSTLIPHTRHRPYSDYLEPIAGLFDLFVRQSAAFGTGLKSPAEMADFFGVENTPNDSRYRVIER